MNKTPKPRANLSERDVDILRVLQNNSNLSIEEIARLARYRMHIVRRSIDKLLESKLITPYAPIQTAALGFCEYQVSLKWNGHQAGELSTLVRKLVRHESVPLVAELAGEVEFTVWAKGTHDFGRVLDDLLAEVPAGVSKLVALRRWFLGLGVVLGEHRESPGILLSHSEAQARIDEVDHQILKAISALGTHNTREVSQATGVPTSTVTYRLKSLKEAGVVFEPRYLVDVSKLGLTRFRVRLETPSTSPIRKKVIEAVRATKEATLLCEVVGPWDYQLELALQDPAAINRVLASLAHKIGHGIRRMEIVPHSGYHKVRNYPFHRFKG